jgi:hypothetical protein
MQDLAHCITGGFVYFGEQFGLARIGAGLEVRLHQAAHVFAQFIRRAARGCGQRAALGLAKDSVEQTATGCGRRLRRSSDG